MAGLFDRLQREIETQEESKGLSPIDLLDLPPDLAPIIRQIVRKNGMELTEIAETLGQTLDEAQKMLDELVEKKYIRRVEVQQKLWYKAQFGRKADRPVDKTVWSVLNSMIEQEEE